MNLSLLTSTFQSWEKICHNISPLLKLYNSFYTKVLKKEILLGGFTANDTILNVGCGSIPFSAIQLKEITGAKVIALDKDRDALEKAHYVLRKNGLNNKIELVEADASKYVPTPFTASLVALQAEPKKEILGKLFFHGQKGVRIIFRQPREILKNQYDYLVSTHLPISEISQSMKTIDKSILYVKE